MAQLLIAFLTGCKPPDARSAEGEGCDEDSFRVPAALHLALRHDFAGVRVLVVALDLFDNLSSVLDSQHDFHLLLDLEHHAVVVLQEHLGVLTALPDALAVVAVPGARLLDDPGLGADVDEKRRVADSFRVHDVEFGLLERWRDLVLDHLHAHVRANDILFLLDRTDAADVQPDRRVELERLTSRCRLGIAEHDADLFAKLIDEHDGRLRAGDGTRELAKRLAHEARLQPDVRVAHLSLDFGLRHQRGAGIDDHDVHGARGDEDLANLQRLFARVRL